MRHRVVSAIVFGKAVHTVWYGGQPTSVQVMDEAVAEEMARFMDAEAGVDDDLDLHLMTTPARRMSLGEEV